MQIFLIEYPLRRAIQLSTLSLTSPTVIILALFLTHFPPLLPTRFLKYFIPLLQKLSTMYIAPTSLLVAFPSVLSETIDLLICHFWKASFCNTQLYVTLSTISFPGQVNAIHSCLESLEICFCSNLMALNPDKSSFILFSISQREQFFSRS